MLSPVKSYFIPIILIGCAFCIFSCTPTLKESSLTLYLKYKSGGTLRLSDSPIYIIKKSTLVQIVALRQMIKAHYAFPIVSDETAKKLREKGYAGEFIPEEIDKKQAMLQEFMTKYDVPFTDLQADWNIQQVKGLMDYGLLHADLKILAKEWSSKSRNPRSPFLLSVLEGEYEKIDEHSAKAIEQGEKALKLLHEGIVREYKTNIEGKAKIQIADDEAVFAFIEEAGSLIVWLLPSSKFTVPEFDVTQSDAIFVETIPETLVEVQETLPSAMIFYTSVPLGRGSVLKVNLLSDTFYNAVKRLSE
jgi:hypothetical protein